MISRLSTLAASAFFAAAPLRAEIFAVSTIDGQSDARQPSLAVDQRGTAHLAYFDDNGLAPSPDAGHVVYRSRPAGGAWSAPLRVGRGWFPAGGNNDGAENTDPAGVSLAVGVDGDVHVAFFSNSGGAYRVWHALIGGGVLKSSAPVSGTGVTYSSYTAVAVDGAGNPRVAFVGPGGVVGYGRFDGVAWSTASADGGARAAYRRAEASDPDEEAVGVRQLALALDATGYAHLAYFDEREGSVKYARSEDGVHFSTQAIDRRDGDLLSGVSLALDGAGLPRVSYVDSESGTFQLYYATRSAGGVWSSTAAMVYDNIWQTGAFLSSALALDGDGNPAIACHGQRGGADAAMFAWLEGGGFRTMAADPADGAASLTLALDGSANPLIAYGDPGDNRRPAGTPAPLHFAAGKGFIFSPPMGGNAGGKVQAPDGLTAAAISSTALTWSWTSHAADDIGYRLFEGRSSTGPFALAADIGAIGPCHSGPCSYTHRGLAPRTPYFAYVAAVSAGGVVTSSGAFAATTGAPPSKP